MSTPCERSSSECLVAWLAHVPTPLSRRDTLKRAYSADMDPRNRIYALQALQPTFRRLYRGQCHIIHTCRILLSEGVHPMWLIKTLCERTIVFRIQIGTATDTNLF